MKTKAIFLAATFSLLGLAGPVSAHHEYHTYSELCFREEVREEYVPGNHYRRGYVRRWKEKVSVPCHKPRRLHNHSPQPAPTNKDDNSCVEGAVLGGILGGGAGAAASRGDGRWWAIPLGIVGGSLVGCQVDGG